MAVQVPYSKRAPAGGGYRISMYSGAIAAGVAAAAPVFSLRWTSTAARMIIQSIVLDFGVTTAYTNAQPIGNSLYFARSFTVSDSGGTAITTTQTADQALDTKQINASGSAQSLLFAGSGDMRIATTAALAAGTRTLDDQALYTWLAGATALGACSNNPDVYFGYQDSTNPLVLRANEGIVITNDILLSAVGVIQLNIGIEWTEVGNNYT
jgi:hypothetical protein